MIRQSLCVIIAFTFLGPTLTWADIYKCQKSGGGMYFQDMPCDTSDQQTSMTTAGSPAAGPTSPAAAMDHLKQALQTGDTSAAQNMFRTLNFEQADFVNKFVAGGINFYSSARVSTKALESFQDGGFAVVAIEQTSPDKSGREIEKGFLVEDENTWKCLPNPEDHHDRINNLAPEESARFDALLIRFNQYKDTQTQ